jgi:hypothetical protein
MFGEVTDVSMYTVLVAVELQPYGSKNLDGYGIHPNFYYRRAGVPQLTVLVDIK